MAEDPMLAAVLNLAHYHREHEKHYSASPLQDALQLQRVSRTYKALAERWSEAPNPGSPVASPFAGAADLNDPRAIEETGVLFMEDGAEPTEIGRLERELATMADDFERTGSWLAQAMEAAWEMAAGLLHYPELADLLAERHRIIANDWQAAYLSGLIARLLRRAVQILDQVEFTTSALRVDLAGQRRSIGYLFSASELIDRAADLAAESATLVHDNERRWRVFRERVRHITTVREDDQTQRP